MTVPFDVIVAADSRDGIGKDGALPWRLKGDMAYFKAVTTEPSGGHGQNAVIMGRRTWESIPSRFRPLSGRKNVVLTRDQAYALPPSVARATTFDQALAELADRPADKIFVIGGARLYREALSHPFCRRIYLTRIEGSFDCDTFLDPIPARFELESRSQASEEGDLTYRFEVYRSR